MSYNDEIKTCENLAEEFFDQLEDLVYSALLKEYRLGHLFAIRDLIKEYKPKMVIK